MGWARSMAWGCSAVWLLMFVAVGSTAGAAGGLRAQRDPAALRRTSPSADWERARQLAAAVAGKFGAPRARALEVAAAAYERCIPEGGCGAAAACAAWAAAELWRRHGSLLLAERWYLVAARRDGARFGQRGLSAAADMQRRQGRSKDALRTYAEAELVDPRTTRAQRARVWIGRLLMARGLLDRGTTQLQAALECARTPRQEITCANELAKAWITRGDLDRAGAVIAHVDRLLLDVGDQDPRERDRLRRAIGAMSARRALQRALDVQHGHAADAVHLDEHRRRHRDMPAPVVSPC